jgi:serine protease inhibitor
MISASNGFAFALLREANASGPGDNVFISPLSASMALGMTMNGAAGTTLDEMRSTLGFGSMPLDEASASYKSLTALLRGLDRTTEVRIANSIWYRDGFPFRDEFFAVARGDFDAEVRGLDFGDASAAGTINDWVRRATGGKIPTIVDAIAPDDVMLLVNAIYFNGAWRARFDAAETREASFASPAGSVAVQLMHGQIPLAYYADDELEAADLAYGNAAYSMTVLLPRPGVSVDGVVAALTPDRWRRVIDGLGASAGDVYLPKFTLTFEQLLNDQLQALGMRSAFLPDGADFTGMSPVGRQLYVSKVLQKSFVDVDEEGTEAAAATSVTIGVTSAGPDHVVFRAHRPFVFAIRERLTGTILFVGKIIAPPRE